MVLSVFTVLPLSINAQEVELAEVGFSIRTSYPGTSNYYYVPRSAANPFAVNSHGGNCTWYAWGRVYEASGEYPNLPRGNANTWYNSAGCAKGSSPRPGAVICGNYGANGHVAFVEKVYDDGVHFDYTESSWDTRYPNFAYNTYKTSANFSGFQGFLYPFDSEPDYVNLGDSFYAFIINTAMWKHLTVEPSINVTIRSEKAAKCPDQVYKFERQSDGSYKIISTANGWCLDVNGASSASGANVSVCGSNDSTAQRWYICGESGQYRLKAKCTDCVLDVAGGSSAEGTNVRMWESNNSDAQKFQIWRWDSRPEVANIGDGFTAPILNTKAWITLENNNGNVILNKEDGKSHQLWKFQRNLDGSYTIFSCLDGLCIDLYNFLHADGTNIGMCGSNNTNAQRWYIYYNGSYFEFQSKESGKFFDVAGGSLASGANIQAYSWNGSDYQRFSIYSGSECKIMAPTLKVEAGTSITDTVFSWNDVYGETGFNLKIWKDKVWEGEAYRIIENADRQTKITLPAGTYQAYVDAYNYYDIKMSNTVSFTVIQDTEPTNPPTTPPTEPPTNPPTEPPTNPPTTPPTEPPTEPSIIKLGDVDGDDKVTIIDATCIQRKLVEFPTAKFVEAAADADEDGELTIIDATVIQRWLAQLPSNNNIGKPIK